MVDFYGLCPEGSCTTCDEERNQVRNKFARVETIRDALQVLGVEQPGIKLTLEVTFSSDVVADTLNDVDGWNEDPLEMLLMAATDYGDARITSIEKA